MEDRDVIVWLVNRTPWAISIVVIVGLLIGLYLGILIFSLAPLWAYIPGLLVALIILVPGLGRIFVFRVGIGNKKAVFKKAHRTIEVIFSEVSSIDVFPPSNPSELSKHWLNIKDRRVSFRLHDGETIEFSPIEGFIAHRLLEAFNEQ